MTGPLAVHRVPSAFDTALGEEARAAVADVAPDHGDLIAGAAGSSPYLKSLIDREKEWLSQALNQPDQALNDVLVGARALPQDELKPGLRQAKRRLALLTALADLAGAWPLEKVTAALTDFGALAADVAAKAESAALIRRGKLPGMTEDDVETAAGMIILAMGKMG
ncbi:MAG: glutamine-synthetase adenylyltransferase, partial [Arenibacterium sp.]